MSVIDKMKELRSKGYSYLKIADELGKSYSFVYFNLNKDAYKKQREYMKKYFREKYRDDDEFKRRMKEYNKRYYQEVIKKRLQMKKKEKKYLLKKRVNHDHD